MSLEHLPTTSPGRLLLQGKSIPGWRVVPGPDGKEHVTPGLLVHQHNQSFFVEYGALIPGVQLDDTVARAGPGVYPSPVSAPPHKVHPAPMPMHAARMAVGPHFSQSPHAPPPHPAPYMMYQRPLFTPHPPSHPPPPIRGSVRGAARPLPKTPNLTNPRPPLRPCTVPMASPFENEHTPEEAAAESIPASPTACAPEALTVTAPATGAEKEDSDASLSPTFAEYEALRVDSMSTVNSLTWGASRTLTELLALEAVHEALEGCS